METARTRADRIWRMNSTSRVEHVFRTQAGPDGLIKIRLEELAELADLEHGAAVYARDQLLRAGLIDRLADSLYRVIRTTHEPGSRLLNGDPMKRMTKTPKRDKPYYITLGSQLQDARDDLQAAIVLAGEHGQQTRVKPLWKALGLLDKVRDVLDEDFYQDGLYEEDPADGIRWPLDTARQRAAEAARRLEELNELNEAR